MIGVFDSGLGGLTVLKEFIRLLPQYDYLYLGDNARAPYGDKDQDTIYRYTREAVDYLFDHGCSLVILACNTASAEALRQLQADYPQRKILGVLIPLAEAAVSTQAQQVGILATRSTVNSGSFPREITKLDATIEVIQQAAPLLVPLIEEDMERHPLTRRVIKKYLLPLRNSGVQTLILGCTHYGFIQSMVESYVGKNMTVLKGGAIVAEKLVDYLQRHPEVENILTRNGGQNFLTTDDARRFDQSAVKYLGRKIKSEHITL